MTVINDTLKLARKWQDAGIEREKAEQMVAALSEELQHGDVATKADLADLKTSLIQWVAALFIAQVAVQTGILIAVLKALLP